LAVVLLGGVLVAVTDNPIRQRFQEVVDRTDVQTDYADDRLAFWQVNLLMWKERPLLGHGEGLGTEYRRPFYVQAGLGHLEKLYEAHNMYLQIAVNGGLVCLGIFLAWFAWYLGKSWRDRRSLGGAMALQALAVFALGALTQNAFQDSEVRYTLSLLCTAVWLRLK
jgi:O-antigen ligase